MTTKKPSNPGLDRRSFIRSCSQLAAGSILMVRNGGLLLAQDAAHVPSPIVETASGKIRGATSGGVHYFKGIHYGASTAGAGRFMPPKKAASWTGIRETVTLGERAPQGGLDIMFRTFPELQRDEPEGEDCLCLNVWTTRVGSAKRPVMVWLHGGGFSTGSGGFVAYDGANLARKEDVVAVTINHRLNAFGFLNVAAVGGAKYAQSANLGLQDIVMALQWVHDNIDRFGGDPGNVTIYGQSGGGRKVSTLLAMPSAQGLFHRAIIQSGSALRQQTPEISTNNARAFLAYMQVSSVDDLQSMPMQKIRAALQAASGGPGATPAAGQGAGGATAFAGAQGLAPVVDGTWLPTQLFEPTAPSISANVPLLVGNNQTENNFFPGTELDPISDETMRSEVKRMTKTDDAGADRIIAAYRQSRPSDTPLDVVQILQTDLDRRHDVRIQADRKSALGQAAVYVYYFDWRSPVHEGKLKSYHTLEIPFVMQNIKSCSDMVGTAPEVAHMADQISGAWAAFARSGDPNHHGLPTWPAYQAGNRPTMILNAQPKVENDPNRTVREAIAAASKLPEGAA
jgi:para-nitrobenzyl esterase